MSSRQHLLAAAILTLGIGGNATGAAYDDHQTKFDALLNTQASQILMLSPEWATTLGVDESVGGKDYGRRLSSYSATGNHQTRALAIRLLRELEAVAPETLTDAQRVSRSTVLYAHRNAASQNALKVGIPSLLSVNSPYAVQQLFGPHLDLPRLLTSQHPLNSQADVDSWLARLKAVPRVLSELVSAAERDAARGVTAPAFALEGAARSARTLVSGAVATHPIITSFSHRLNSIRDLDKEARTRHIETAIAELTTGFYPAYERFANRLEKLASGTPDGAGVWRLTNGDDVYRVALDAYGANGRTPQRIHELGQADVKRIQQEMDAILRASGYATGSLGERLEALAQDPRMVIPNTDVAKSTVIEDLQRRIESVLGIADRWFARLPAAPIEVRRIPAHEQDAAAGAYYLPPPLTGDAPGVFWINLKDMRDWPRYTLPTLAHHEAVPGHHFQAAFQQSTGELPLIRNLLFFAENGEGWAMYAEELAVEMGLYKDDPLGNLGRLRAELYRAARLVVDTGLHHHRWSRERAIGWMSEVTGENETAIAREIERYAVWPGQATSYKLGMIQFQTLRKRAESRLADRFDIRQFHDAVLRIGSVPLPVLEQEIDQWIDQQR